MSKGAFMIVYRKIFRFFLVFFLFKAYCFYSFSDFVNLHFIEGLYENKEPEEIYKDSKLRIRNYPEFYAKMIEAYKLIFQTQTGKDILDTTFLCSSELLSKAIGLDTEDVKPFLESCLPSQAKEKKIKAENLVKIFSYEKRREILLFKQGECDCAEFDAFTQENLTFLKRELFEDKNHHRLLTTLAHELATYIDSSFKYEAVFIHKFLDSEMQRQDHFAYIKLKRTERNMAFYDLLTAPVLKSTLASLRAYDLERKIVEDLVETQQEVSFSDIYNEEEVDFFQQSCHVKLKAIWDRLKNISPSKTSKVDMSFGIWKVYAPEIMRSQITLSSFESDIFSNPGGDPFLLEWTSHRPFPLTEQRALKYSEDNLKNFQKLDSDNSLCETLSAFEIPDLNQCNFSYRDDMCHNRYGGFRPRIRGVQL